MDSSEILDCIHEDVNQWVGWISHFWLFNDIHFVLLEALTMLDNTTINIFLLILSIILYHVFSWNIYGYR